MMGSVRYVGMDKYEIAVHISSESILYKLLENVLGGNFGVFSTLENCLIEQALFQDVRIGTAIRLKPFKTS